jgi:hypothetical protein
MMRLLNGYRCRQLDGLGSAVVSTAASGVPPETSGFLNFLLYGKLDRFKMNSSHKPAFFRSVLVKAAEDCRTPRRFAFNEEHFVTRGNVSECSTASGASLICFVCSPLPLSRNPYDIVAIHFLKQL